MNIITDLYEIKITSNKNNLNLNDTCTITVQAIDFNGNNIAGKNIKLEVNKGGFSPYTIINQNVSFTYANGYTKFTFTNIHEGQHLIINAKDDFATIIDIPNISNNIISDLTNNGIPLECQNVTLEPYLDSSNEIYYEGYNSTSIIDNYLSPSYTGTTGANGFTIKYKASENGIITFKSQNSNLQIQCGGWKKYTLAVTHGKDCYLYINENQRKAFLIYECTLTNYTGAGHAQTVENLDIPAQYKPSLSSVRAVGTYITQAWVLTTNGEITYRVQTNQSGDGAKVRFRWTY